MSEPETLTKSEFAAELMVGRPRISQLISQGLPVQEDGRIAVLTALNWIVENLDPLWCGNGSLLWHAANEWLELFDLKPVRRSRRGRPENRA
jgi:hypothetical protein